MREEMQCSWALDIGVSLLSQPQKHRVELQLLTETPHAAPAALAELLTVHTKRESETQKTKRKLL